VEQLELFKDNHPPELRRRKSKPKEWKVVSLRECPAPESMIKMDRPPKAVKYWQQHIATTPEFNSDVEYVVVLVLNTKLRIKGHYIVSQGALNEAMAQPREVFRIAVMAAAYAIVLMHNHPSGESDPSDADRAITRRLSEAAEILRIELCDHIIVGHQRYFSFRESGLMK
jgi:DNA repair protein RadC